MRIRKGILGKRTTVENKTRVEILNGTNTINVANIHNSNCNCARTKNGTLSFCKNHKIGTWNVITMNTVKLDIVKREMERTRVEILGISELKWTEMGHFQSDEYKVFFCGQDHVRRNGVAIICDKDTSFPRLQINLRTYSINHYRLVLFQTNLK